MSVFKMNDLVWAKMKGFPPWPGLISEPPKHLKGVSKKNSAYHCIFFFGTNNYSWIEESNLKSYQAFKDELRNSNKSASFRTACEDIEKYIQKGPASFFSPTEEEDEFDKLVESDSSPNTDKGKGKKLKGILKKPSSTPANKKVALQLSKKESGSKSTPQKKIPKLRKEQLVGAGSRKRWSDTNIIVKSKKRMIHVTDADSTLPDPQPGPSKVPADSLQSVSSHLFKKGPGTNLLQRPANTSRPEVARVNLDSVSETLLSKKIEPTTSPLGFLGLGIMGSGIVKNLLDSGHKLTLWNRSPEKSADFQKAGAEVALTPSDVVQASDITFCCVSDSRAAKEMVFGNCGALMEMGTGKAYVEMTGVDAETSLDIAEAVTSRGGKYLEVRFQGSKKEAEEGTLIILAAGDRSVFNDCKTCFQAMGKNAFFLGEAGNASKMNLILQLVSGITLAGLAEGLALADRAGLKQDELLKILKLSLINCPFVVDKCVAIQGCNYATNMSLSHLQNNVKQALMLGDSLEQPLPLGATTNEHFKHAKKLGYGDHDSSAVFVGARF